MQQAAQQYTTGAPLPDALGAWAENAEILASEGVRAFSQVIDCLSEIRNLQTSAIDDLGSFATLAVGEENQSGDPLDLLQCSIEAMHTALANFCKGHGGGESKSCHAEVERLLSDINRNGQTLAVVATLTRTTAASYGISTFAEYVDELGKIAVIIRDASKSVLSNLVELSNRDAASVSSCTYAFEHIGNLMHIVEIRSNEIKMLQQKEQEAASGISSTSESLVNRSRQRMKTFVTAVQFSDRLAQRLEHLSDMLAREGDNLELLAAAQARSIAIDVADVAKEVSETMQALSEIWHQGADVYSSGTIAQSIEHSLTTRKDTAQFIVSKLADVRTALRTTARDAETLPFTIKAANESFARLEASTLAVANSAMNSSLIASRSQQAKNAMVTLSFEVRDTASNCLAAVKGSQQALKSIAEQGMFGIQDLTDSGQALEEAITAYESQIEAGQARLRNVDAVRSRASDNTAQLLEQVRDAIQSMRDVDLISDRLNAMADRLEQLDHTIQPEDEILTTVWNSYTMEEERTVHLQIYPSAGDQGSDAPDPATDDIDDMFF